MMGVFVQLNEGSHMAEVKPIGYVICENGCWEWVGGLNSNGYGKMKLGKASAGAHRVVYEMHRGPIPEGLHLDHLCRKPDCVNPDHLEPVTNRENMMRGENFAAKNAAKTHCHRGHPFEGDNLIVIKRSTPGRNCRTCRDYLQNAQKEAP